MTDRADTPFEVLRLPATPLAPRPEFAAALRARLTAELHPTDPSDPAARDRARTEAPMTDTTATDTATSTAAPASPLIPYLVVSPAADAIDWYRDVFGAIEVQRHADADGRVGHAELAIGPARLYLADEFPDLGLRGPRRDVGSPVSLYLEVVDADHTHGRAVAAGAESQGAPVDEGHGHRTATVIDPFGHRWFLSQPIDAERTAAAAARPAPTDDAAAAAEPAWTVTGRRPAEPGYLVLYTRDLDRARAFYGAVFDWEVEPGHVEGGGHIANTHFPMGFFADDNPDRRAPTTLVNFRVDDLEPYLQRVAEHGGQVLAVADYESGGNAECLDDQGFRFDLFRPNPGY